MRKNAVQCSFVFVLHQIKDNLSSSTGGVGLEMINNYISKGTDFK